MHEDFKILFYLFLLEQKMVANTGLWVYYDCDEQKFIIHT